MAMKFISGKTTNRFDVLTTEEEKDKMATIISDMDVFKKETEERFQRERQTTDEQIKLVENKLDGNISRTDNAFNNINDYRQVDRIILYNILASPIIRFLNYFFHWYIIILFKNAMYSSDVYSISFAPAIDANGNKMPKENFDIAMKSYRDHWKEIKKKGIKYRDLLFN